MTEQLIENFFGANQQQIDTENYRCGFIAIVGRPNVGKSTLLNHLLGQKLSITSRKPQTTRHKILGIVTQNNVQAIYVDTPGMHKRETRAINRYMNKEAQSALKDVDLILFVVDGLKWTPDDDLVLEKLQYTDTPVILVLNKVDTVADKAVLLPYVETLSQKRNFSEIIPLSALKGHNLATLHELVGRYLPFAPPMYGEDQITDRSQRFLASEIIREKIMRQMGDEVPYDLTVQIEGFKIEGHLYRIDATILVERDGQKAIVIGEGGQKLKSIGKSARLDMEKLFDAKVMLTLWVKVKGGWSDDERALKSLGYGDI
ncbi:MAG: GTPase Era [Moraxellaceae bacterium]|jgi:GTP-binding protein Era|nr:GTPase Era [Moraxellaceae bacterium]